MADQLKSYERKDILFWLKKYLYKEDIPGLMATFLNNNPSALFSDSSSMTFENMIDWLISNDLGYQTLVRIIEVLIELDNLLTVRNIKSLEYDFDMELDNMPGGPGKISRLLKVLIDLEIHPGWGGFYDWLIYDLEDVRATEAAEKKSALEQVGRNIQYLTQIR